MRPTRAGDRVRRGRRPTRLRGQRHRFAGSASRDQRDARAEAVDDPGRAAGGRSDQAQALRVRDDDVGQDSGRTDVPDDIRVPREPEVTLSASPACIDALNSVEVNEEHVARRGGGRLRELRDGTGQRGQKLATCQK